MLDNFILVSHERKKCVIILHMYEILSQPLNNMLICWCISTKSGSWIGQQ